jgi:hypothetical protein
MPNQREPTRGEEVLNGLFALWMAACVPFMAIVKVPDGWGVGVFFGVAIVSVAVAFGVAYLWAEYADFACGAGFFLFLFTGLLSAGGAYLMPDFRAQEVAERIRKKAAEEERRREQESQANIRANIRRADVKHRAAEAKVQLAARLRQRLGPGFVVQAHRRGIVVIGEVYVLNIYFEIVSINEIEHADCYFKKDWQQMHDGAGSVGASSVKLGELGSGYRVYLIEHVDDAAEPPADAWLFVQRVNDVLEPCMRELEQALQQEGYGPHEVRGRTTRD